MSSIPGERVKVVHFSFWLPLKYLVPDSGKYPDSFIKGATSSMFYQITDCQMPCTINLVFLISTMIKDEIVSDPHLPNIDFSLLQKKLNKLLYLCWYQ